MRVVVLSLVALAALASLDACANAKKDTSPTAKESSDASAEPAVDAQVAAFDAGRGDAAELAAANFQTSVVDGPAWPESNVGTKRLGYLRNGAVVAAYDRPIVNDDCKDGWYELVGGGYVCGKATTFDLASPRVRLAPKQPDRDAGLPYRYGVSVADGTPLYRRVLGADDRKKFEELPKEKDDSSKASAKEGNEKEEQPVATEEESAPSASATAAPAPTPSASSGSSRRTAESERDAGADAGAKRRLKDLKGRGVVVRKLARGFHLGLDREFKAAGTKWWRTTFGFAVPFDRVALTPSVTKYSNAWLGSGTPIVDTDGGVVADDAGAQSLAGAVGFVQYEGAHKLEVNEDRTKVAWGADLPKRSAVAFTGREATIGGVTYYETTNGFWLRLGDVKLAHPAPPADLAEGEKWIDVDLTRQMLVAYEGRKPVFATLVSSGRRNPQDKEHDFPTPPGSYRIREKHVTTTMDGDVASDGPYSIEDVPWVMYFQGSYAIHGAFWHDGFGHPRSHGCVNVSPDDARALFGWADPPLPDGWHGVFARDDKQGSRVIVHEDKPPKRRARAAAEP